MIDKVYTLLSAIGVPVDHIHRPLLDENNTKAISYHFFNQGTLKFGDGESKVDGGALQIDLFVLHDGKTSPNATIGAIKTAMKNAKFKLADASESNEYVEGIGDIDQYTFKYNYKE